jgi:hypothetical protein
MHGPELTFHAKVMNANILVSNLFRTKYYISPKLKKCNHTRSSFKFFACKLSIEIGAEGYVSRESKTKLRAHYQKRSHRRNVLHQEVLSGDHGDGVKRILNWLFVEAKPGKNATGISTGAGTRPPFIYCMFFRSVLQQVFEK